MHKKFIKRLFLFLSLVVIPHHPVFSQQSASLDSNLLSFKSNLQELIKASQNNPALKAADAAVTSSTASANAQKSLDPPQVGIEFYQSPVSAFPDPFKDQMEYDYSIQQMIPFPGKLGAMAGAERKRTEMLKADRRTREQDIIEKVKSLYFELYLKDRKMEINHETNTLVRGFVEIAQKQYQVGMGKQSDVLRAQTELSSLVNDSIVLVQERKSMAGMLNALCNKPVSDEIGTVPEIDPVTGSFDVGTLTALADKNRPELRSMQSGVEMRQAELSAAQKEYLPDFMIRGMYKQMTQNTDNWSVMIGATIPIAPWSLNKYSSGTARADATILGAQSDVVAMKNMIAAEVNDALLKMESAKARLDLSKKTAIPQAQEALESALSAYRTGKQEFLMLIDIQRMLVMAKLDYHMAVMALLDSQGRLERAVGLDLDKIEKSIERGNR